MKDIAPFKIDKWLLDHGSKEKIDLHGSYIAAMSMNQLKQLSNDSSMSPFDGDLQLTYGNAQGSVALRRRIAELHSSEDVQLSEENVIVTTGSILANYLVLTCLFGPTDHVICQYPTYGQLYILPRFQGAEVDLWRLQADCGWVPDVDKLSRMIKPNTRAIIINNPGNPAGTVIPKSQLHEIIHLARTHNLLVFSDEVFHPLFHGVEAPPPLVSLGYDRSISTGSVSKAHGLPGLRLGWVVSPDRSLLGRIMTARDYTTIAVSQLDDSVAAFALSPAVLPRLLERNLAVCSRTIEILRAFVKRNPGRCVWLPPQGAGTAFIQVLDGNGRPADDVAFSVQLLEKFGVSVIPGGHCFGDDLDGDFKGYIRISLGEEEGLKRALPLLQECLDQYK